jgi:hypothetical protein
MIMIGIGALLVLLAAVYFMKSKKKDHVPHGTPGPKSSVWQFISSGGVSAPAGSNYTLTINPNGSVIASDSTLFPLVGAMYNQNTSMISGKINNNDFAFKVTISIDGTMALADPLGANAFVLRRQS